MRGATHYPIASIPNYFSTPECHWTIPCQCTRLRRQMAYRKETTPFGPTCIQLSPIQHVLWKLT